MLNIVIPAISLLLVMELEMNLYVHRFLTFSFVFNSLGSTKFSIS